jgi:hypothetical protein
LKTHSAEIGDDPIGAAIEERGCLRPVPNPNDKAETANPSRRCASCCILKHDGVCWGNPETSRGFEEHIRSRLSGETEAIKIDTVDTCIEQRRQVTRTQNFRTVVAG